ncbi:LPS assembly protein LptD [Myxococcus sp. K15C18031901]|uniref:LPS-assembly protein LptD n=1 Tax=Myxococcus dinghuensis TaxID=2906761 RepID=UPI0020A6DE12|nr:LPS assembly protein LptD [Myxococcus dinghuensis]MCP3101765.1 LPS assembly protein LptD [Myxococcus dinghuensis]
MSLLVPLAAALLVSSAQIPLATQVQLPSGETVELAADFLTYEADKQVLTARGHCELRTGEMLLRSDEVTYDEANQVATATGNVMFVGPGGMAAVADDVRVDLRSFEATLQGGLFMQKKGVTFEALLTAKTPQELRAMGETPVLLSGSRIRRTGPNAFVVDELAFTPCECGPGDPSWRVEASSANVVLGERATLSWPVVYVQSVPVFALPWLYLPLAERRSGLLLPQPTFSGVNGLTLSQPVFLTLGRSYDLTFTPGFYVGKPLQDLTFPNPPVDGQPVIEYTQPHINGVRGPRLLTEFRYVPSEKTRGRATLGLLHDSRPLIDPTASDFYFYPQVDGQPRRYVNAPRGLRGEASWQHYQDLGDGWVDRVDAAFVSDGFYTRDLTADVIARELDYIRSTATVFRRKEDSYVGLDVSLRQDIRTAYRFFQTNRVPSQLDPARPEVPTPKTFQRLPGLVAALPERPLFGGLVGGLRAEYTRQAPMTGGFADDGIDVFRANGTYTPFFFVPDPADPGKRPADPGQSNGIFDFDDRESRDRVDFTPRLTTSVALGDVAQLTPSLGLRQDVWLGEVSGRTWQRGYPVAGLMLESQLARTWTGSKSSFRHAISPSLELRYVPGGWGRVPSAGWNHEPGAKAQPYDEIDRAVPLRFDGRTQGFFQAVLAVDQTLRVKTGTNSVEPLRLRVGQGFDLSHYAPIIGGRPDDDQPILRDTFARLSARAGWLTAGGLVRFDPNEGRLTQLSADLNLDDGKGHALYARYDDILSTSQDAIDLGENPFLSGPDAIRRPLDALVGSVSRETPGLPPAKRAQALIVGTRLTLGFGLGVRYEALVQPLYQDSTNQEYKPFAQQTLGVSYGPACNCWRIEGVVTKRRDSGLEFSGVNLIVTGFGAFGSGG